MRVRRRIIGFPARCVIAMGAGSTAALSAFDHLIRTSAPDAEQAAAA